MSDDPRAPVAGAVAIEVARQLADPLRALRDRLALVVDHLERHVASSTGPTPYPWRSLQSLRQDLAGAYLEATTITRRLDELDRALDDDPPAWFDVPAAIELGLHLAGHHLASGTELLIDIGGTPAARGTAGAFALVIAQLVALSADSARSLEGSTLSVRSFAEDGFSVVLITDNGAGSARASELGDLARAILEPWGATIDAASADGQGTSFELRLVTSA